tara:strand:- start:34982 stop:35224 length:243 start_codon:yes stop_codon:yes gene_type:complete
MDIRKTLEKIEQQLDSNGKYLSANQIEIQYGISSKQILNRSNLPVNHKRHIPSVRLKGGRKKYFERKVFERMIKTVRSEE